MTRPLDSSTLETLDILEEEIDLQAESVTRPITSIIYDKFFSSKRSIGRFMFILIAFAYTFYQIYEVSKFYLRYPSRVSIESEALTDLEYSLPGVTICNKNLISTEEAFNRNSKDIEEVEKVHSSLDQFMANLSALSLTIEPQVGLSPELLKKKIEIYESYMSTYYAKLSVATQLNHGPALDKFVVHLSCNRKGWPIFNKTNRMVQETSFLCEDRKWIHTAQGKGNCITFFHGSAPMDDGSHDRRKASRFVVDISPITKSPEQFVPLELSKFVVDFGPENYTDLRKEPGGEVMVHDNRSIPLEASLSYTIQPGKYYLFHVQKSSTHSLPPPYRTMCRDYYGEYSRDYQRSIANITAINNMPLSRTHCLEHCLLVNVLKKLKCWPKQIPFVSGYQLTPLLRELHETIAEKNVVWCHRKYPDDQRKLIEIFQNFTIEERQCNKNCSRDCLRDYYQTFFQEVEWPSEEAITVESDINVREKLRKLKSCCALISLRYTTNQVHINDVQATMPLVEYLSAVGGILSMFIGVSLLSVYSLIEFFTDRFYFRRRANTITTLRWN